MLTSSLAASLSFSPLLAVFAGGILWAIVGIGFLIFIHEYGHYTACRLTGTRVETFSIGFGPRLFGWERDRTGRRRFTWGRRQLLEQDHAMDFRVAAIPLGGYVKMAGENPGQPRSGASDEFASQSIPERLFIVSAGVIMNAITALVFYAIAFGGGLEKEPPIAGRVELGSPAWKAGMKPGDRVLEVDGNPLSSFVDLRVEAAFLPRDGERSLVVERQGRRESLRVTGRYSEDQGVMQLGVGQPLTLTLGSGAGALRVGPSDAVEVNGVPLVGSHALLDRLDAALEAGVPAVVRTPGGAEVRLVPDAATPSRHSTAAPWKLGIEPHGALRVVQARGAAAGLLPGDEVSAVEAGGVRTPLTSGVWERLPESLERVEALVVKRGAQDVLVPTPGVGDRAAVYALIGDVEWAHGAVIAPLAPGRLYFEGDTLYRYASVPAAGKLAPGERILAVGSTPVETFAQVVKPLAALQGADPVVLRIQGVDGVQREETLIPVALERVGAVAFDVAALRSALPSSGPLDAVAQGAGRLWREVKNTFRTIGSFFSGSISFKKNIAGPITLVNASKRASEDSFLDLLWFLAYVSVMLAVLNILPIPVLDGGHVVFLIAERLRGGRPLSDVTIGRLQLVGMVLLLTLMVFAIRNDISINF